MKSRGSAFLTAICHVYTFLFLIQTLPAFVYTQLSLDFIRRSVNIALSIWVYLSTLDIYTANIGGGQRRQLDTTADGGAMAAGGGMKMPVTTPPMNPNSI